MDPRNILRSSSHHWHHLHCFFGKKKDSDDLEDDYIDEVPGMPKRYCYEELIAGMDNFSRKLGQGGFGSAFEGILSNGTMVAVK
ncbi:hypothetical protein Pint_23166 [Pistacia integerrima]|uniref:Uncharacterized protein n=1 Tax=Pistacia integerrima TaxID=434235 RepID=A0ACC0YH50_9ROSI|nr:hypothetical protein Pint_23166 [Pistacia integerrima]